MPSACPGGGGSSLSVEIGDVALRGFLVASGGWATGLKWKWDSSHPKNHGLWLETYILSVEEQLHFSAAAGWNFMVFIW